MFTLIRRPMLGGRPSETGIVDCREPRRIASDGFQLAKNVTVARDTLSRPPSRLLGDGSWLWISLSFVVRRSWFSSKIRHPHSNFAPLTAQAGIQTGHASARAAGLHDAVSRIAARSIACRNQGRQARGLARLVAPNPRRG